MKLSSIIVSLAITASLPISTAYGNYGNIGEISDTSRVRSNSVGSCDSTISKYTVQAGIYGDLSDNNGGSYYNGDYSKENQDGNKQGMYMQLVIPFGGPDPIDCTKLARLMEKDYQMDLELKELELQIKRKKLELMAEGLNDYSEIQANTNTFSE